MTTDPDKRPYAYIHQRYGLDFFPGNRVRLEDTDRCGTVARMRGSAGHYVQVRFDGHKHSSPCHPESLIILTADAGRLALAQDRGGERG